MGVPVSMPVSNMGIQVNPSVLRYANQVTQPNPYYCTFLPQTGGALPAHFTTGRGQMGNVDNQEPETFNIDESKMFLNYLKSSILNHPNFQNIFQELQKENSIFPLSLM